MTKTHTQQVKEGSRKSRWLQDQDQDDELQLTAHHLYLNQVTEAEWLAKKRARERDKQAMNALLADKTVDGLTKQQRRCEYIIKYGRTLYSCPRCWLLPGLCVCHHMATLNAKTRVLVHVHQAEWGKSSNTGCVAGLSLPSQCDVLLKGYQPHDDVLQSVLQDPCITTAVLWPGERSILPSELKAIAGQRTGGRLAVIAVDASWDAACRMKGSYPPDILHVRLGPDSTLRESGTASLLSPVRRYRGDLQNNGRVSTLEAIACLLYELEGDEQLLAGLLDNLRTKVDAMLVQKLRQPVYGTVAAGLYERAREGAAQVQKHMPQVLQEQELRREQQHQQQHQQRQHQLASRCSNADVEANEGAGAQIAHTEEIGVDC